MRPHRTNMLKLAADDPGVTTGNVGECDDCQRSEPLVLTTIDGMFCGKCATRHIPPSMSFRDIPPVYETVDVIQFPVPHPMTGEPQWKPWIIIGIKNGLEQTRPVHDWIYVLALGEIVNNKVVNYGSETRWARQQEVLEAQDEWRKMHGA